MNSLCSIYSLYCNNSYYCKNIQQNYRMKQGQNDLGADGELQQLLQQFNKIDKKKMGSIKLTEALKLLKQECSVQLLNQQILDRLVFSVEKHVTFDQFLALKYQAQIQNGIHKDLVNYKMLSFMNLLEDYRKKCEEGSMYIQAQKAHQKIIQIKDKEMRRHKQKLLLQQKSKVLSVNSLQHGKLVEFNTAWNSYMEKYEDAAIGSIQKLKAKHLREMEEEQERIIHYYQNYLKPSKRAIQLRQKQKILVKQKQYLQADKLKKMIDRLDAKQRQSRTVEISGRMQKRKETLQKHQQAALLVHLKRIEKDRNEQIKQRQLDSQTMLIKLKNIQNDIVQKQSIEIRDTLQNLRQTMCLSSGQFRSRAKVKSNEQLPQIKASHQPHKSFKARINSFHRNKLDISLYNP